MQLHFNNLDNTDSYQKLLQASRPDLKAILTPERIAAYTARAGSGINYNYSAKEVDSNILALLEQLSQEQQLHEKYMQLLSGAVMNKGENRMVLHHYTRGNFLLDNSTEVKAIESFYREEKKRFIEFAHKIHTGQIKGSTGAKFDTAVQIGIGGSDLGPRAIYTALKGYMESEGRTPYMKCEFISNVDPDDAADVMKRINPETTLFILVSKSGTTQETLTNRNLVLKLIKEHSDKIDPSKHMAAVTSKTSPLASSSDFAWSFFIDDFVGGRYSSTSAVGGVILSLAFGGDIFQQFLDGAHENDLIAFEKDIFRNPPLLDALTGVYERNISGYPVKAILPYSQALSRFPAHLQQLFMESNGKRVNSEGGVLNYSTCPVIFGEPGTNGQHSFYQQLHQGTDIVPIEFIGFYKSQRLTDSEFEGSTCQKKLNANLAAQITAFTLGDENKVKNRDFPGKRPCGLITGERLTPSALGSLLAHYENTAMFQGFLWNINSFDQEGVQLGKRLAEKALKNSGDSPVLEAYSTLLGFIDS